MSITAAQIRMARAAMDWTLRECAHIVGIELSTLHRIEKEHTKRIKPETMLRLREAFETGGVEFGLDGWIRLANRPGTTAEA